MLCAGERDFALKPAQNESPLPVTDLRRIAQTTFGERLGEG